MGCPSYLTEHIRVTEIVRSIPVPIMERQFSPTYVRTGESSAAFLQLSFLRFSGAHVPAGELRILSGLISCKSRAQEHLLGASPRTGIARRASRRPTRCKFMAGVTATSSTRTVARCPSLLRAISSERLEKPDARSWPENTDSWQDVVFPGLHYYVLFHTKQKKKKKKTHEQLFESYKQSKIKVFRGVIASIYSK